MNDNFETGYQTLQGFSEQEEEDEIDDNDPGNHNIRILPGKNRARWNHIENLDEFFTRTYQYHQRSGFACMVMEDVMMLVQFAFVVLFTSFMVNCVNYDELLDHQWTVNSTHKVPLNIVTYPSGECINRIGSMQVLCLIVASLFWVFRLVKVFYNILKYFEIRAFYTTALNISTNDLSNMTWHEVQKRLLVVQKKEQMCIHKEELTQLDIYHRILRFKNYLVAMINKDVLPVKFQVPIFGDTVFLTTGLRYNFELLLFWGPWAPFRNYWHLDADYKSYQNRRRLAEDLSQKIAYAGIVNLILLPLIFLWQILYFFFRYAEIFRREPGALGARCWSMYSRLYLRHFNELDHEFMARLNRGYRFSSLYMGSFTSAFITIIAKHLAFMAGAVLSVLVILAFIDDDIMQVEHMLSIMAGLTAVIAICRALIPDEHMIWCPERLMRLILSQIHYMPDHWKGSAHTYKVRDEFAQLFQYKAVYLLEELMSPFITPFILIFVLRKQALSIVDFYRNHTVEVIGVGDVCAFAQMDIRKHGNPQWVPEENTAADSDTQAEGGKVELSLLHFGVTNPEYNPPPESRAFVEGLRNQVQRDAAGMSLQPLDNPLAESLPSVAGFGFTSVLPSLPVPSFYPPNTHMGVSSRSAGSAINPDNNPPMRGGLKNCAGPLAGSGGLLSSLQQTQNNYSSLLTAQSPGVLGFSQYGSMLPQQQQQQQPVINPAAAAMNGSLDEGAIEQLSNDMNFSALYLHAIHDRRLLNPHHAYFDDEDAHQRNLWRTDHAPLSPQGHTQQGQGHVINQGHVLNQGHVDVELRNMRGASEGAAANFGATPAVPQSADSLFGAARMPHVDEEEDEDNNESGGHEPYQPPRQSTYSDLTSNQH